MLSVTKETYKSYKRVFEIIWLFQAQHAKMDPNAEFSPIRVLDGWEQKSMSLARRGLKEGLRDTLSQMISLPNEYKSALNEQLVAENFPTLSNLISTVKEIPNKVLRKGKIKNIDEFYVVKEVVDDLTYEIADTDRIELNNLLGLFENNYKAPKNSR